MNLKALAGWATFAALAAASFPAPSEAAFLGPEFIVSPTDTQSTYYLSAAFDPVKTQGKVLVVWDQYGNGFDVYGQVISATGIPLGANFTVTNAPNYQYYPSLDYDPYDNEYLVAWTDSRSGSSYTICGQIIDGSGSPVGSNFSISSADTNQWYPEVAFDTADQKFLVSWYDNRAGVAHVYGQFISPNGTFVGGDFTISTPSSSYGEAYPREAYDSVNHRFLVVYTVYLSQEELHGQLVSPDTTLIGSDFTISAVPNDNPEYKALAFDPANQRYLVVWQGNREGTNDNIYGQVLGADGSPVGGGITVSGAPNNQIAPAVSYDPVTQRYLVSWQDYRVGNWDIYGQLVGSDGSLAGNDFSIAGETSDQLYPASVYDYVNQRFVEVYTNGAYAYHAFGRVVLPGGVTSTALPDGYAHVPYVAQIFASGGTQPFTWTVEAGSLPPGLAITAATGAITGVPLTAGVYSFTAHLTDAQGYEDFAPLSITVYPNDLPPTVTLGATPTSGTSPLAVTFVATASDPDGSIVAYRWDFDGDGTVDEVTASGTASHTYTGEGAYLAEVTVVDSSGVTAMAAAAIDIPPSAQTIIQKEKAGCGCTLVRTSSPEGFLSSALLALVPLAYVLWEKKRRRRA